MSQQSPVRAAPRARAVECPRRRDRCPRSEGTVMRTWPLSVLPGGVPMQRVEPRSLRLRFPRSCVVCRMSQQPGQPSRAGALYGGDHHHNGPVWVCGGMTEVRLTSLGASGMAWVWSFAWDGSSSNGRFLPASAEPSPYCSCLPVGWCFAPMASAPPGRYFHRCSARPALAAGCRSADSR